VQLAVNPIVCRQVADARRRIFLEGTLLLGVKGVRQHVT
jgi:hypothetical protein